MRILLRQYVAGMSMEAGACLGEGPIAISGYLLRLLRVAALVGVWRVILKSKPEIGITLEQLLAYTVVSEALSEFLVTRTGIDNAWFTGGITTRFTRPMGLLHQFSAELLGRAAVGVILFGLPLLLTSMALGVRCLPHGTAAGMAFVPSFVLSFVVGLGLEYCTVGVGVWLSLHPFIVQNVRTAATMVLSGALIPLAMLPQSVAQVFAWLPFASQASTPLRIYTGVEENPASMMVRQLIWACITWPVAIWVWRKGREKMVSFGG